jgi:Domain of unknown function (DUF929)
MPLADKGLDEASMGKASRTKVEVNRREKIAAQRAAERRSQQRRRILIASGSIVVVLAVVLVFVVVKLNSKNPSGPSSASNGPTGAALTAVIDKTTSVPASTLDAVGKGGFGNKIQTITGNPTPLASGGKPEMLYVGAEYCPYCGVTRWAMIVALSRFGTFSGLSTVHSSSTDVYPNTPSWTFYKSSYTSKYLTFTPVELQTNIPDPNNTPPYTNLQTPTSAQQALLTKYDTAPYTTQDGAVPFIDFGNKYLMIGSPFIPSVLDGLSWSTIANDLHNPKSAVAEAVDGTANYFTAAICKLTGNQPASACTSTVQSLESQL